MVLAKSMFIFFNEQSFFTFFAPLTCLDHIPFELLLFGPGVAERAQTWGGPLLNFLLKCSLGGASRHLARTRSQVHFGLAI